MVAKVKQNTFGRHQNIATTMRLTIFIVCLMSVSLSTCKPKKHTFDALPPNLLQFGTGGGVTGATTTFTLLENGQLFKTTSLDKKTVALEAIDEKEAKLFFGKAKELFLVSEAIKQPGNLYYFIRWVEGEGTKTLTWGSLDFEVPEDINQMHNELLAKTK